VVDQADARGLAAVLLVGDNAGVILFTADQHSHVAHLFELHWQARRAELWALTWAAIGAHLAATMRADLWATRADGWAERAAAAEARAGQLERALEVVNDGHRRLLRQARSPASSQSLDAARVREVLGRVEDRLREMVS